MSPALSHTSDPAFIETMLQHKEQLLHFLLQKTQDLDIAEELLQKTLLKAQLHQQQLQKIDAMGGWLQRIAFNEYVSWLRSPQRRHKGLEESPVHIEEENPEQLILQQERKQLVREAIAVLPQHEQEVVDAFYLQEQDYQTISTMQSLSHSAIASRLHKARMRLKDQLQRTLRGFGYIGAQQQGLSFPGAFFGFLSSLCIACLLFLFPFAMSKLLRANAEDKTKQSKQLRNRYAMVGLLCLSGGLCLAILKPYRSWWHPMTIVFGLTAVFALVEALFSQLSTTLETKRERTQYPLVFGFALLILSQSLLVYGYAKNVSWGIVYLFWPLGLFAVFVTMRGCSSFFEFAAERKSQEPISHISFLPGLKMLGVGVFCLSAVWYMRLAQKIAFVPWLALAFWAGLFLIMDSCISALLQMYQKRATIPKAYLYQALCGALICHGAQWLSAPYPIDIWWYFVPT